MRRKNHLIIFVCSCCFVFTACFKTKIAPVPPIVGRWQETKASVYLRNYSGSILRDTTYLDFNLTDYAQFDDHGNCTINATRTLNPAGGPSDAPAEYIGRLSLSYAPIASKYVLYYPANPSNPAAVVRDTLTMIDASTIRIRYVYDDRLKYTVSDAWYTKINPGSIK